MIRCAIYDKQTHRARFGDETLLAEFNPYDEQWLWLDLDNESLHDERQILMERFSINELAVMDAQRTRHPPKMEAFEDYVFILLRGLSSQSESIDYQTIQIALFVGKNFLITRHGESSLSVNRAWDAAQSGKLDLAKGLGHVAFRISRNVVDRYTPILLALEDRLDAMEDEMFANPNDELLAELVNYNSRLKKLRRTLAYQRDIFAALTKYKSSVFIDDNYHEFNDVYEQFERLSSLSQLYQEIVSDLINGYLSLSSHRLNQIMRVLTIATVVFLPLGLLAGVYGMNFENMPELSWRYGYFAVLTIMVSLVGSIILVLRKIKWL